MTAPSPGWYPHPDDPSSLRWWDGSAWTAFVAPNPAAAAAAEAPAPEPEPVEPTPAPEPEPEPIAPVTPLPSRPVAPDPVPPAAARGRGRLVVAGLAVAAAAGVAAVLALGGDATTAPARHAGPPAADRLCLRLWNGTDTADALALRNQASQFRGAYARLVRVAPLPGTLMQPGSCALEAYQPETDTHFIAVAGVKDQIGYLDVTAYPRAATYGWPESAKQANVRIGADGVVRAIVR